MTKEQLLEYIDVYIRQQGDYGAVRIAPVLEALVNNMGEGGVIPSGGTADRPENPIVGTQYFDTDLGKVVTWDGTEWVESGGDDGNLLLELPYLTGNFKTPTLGSGITDMPTLVAKIKAAKSVTLRNPSGISVGCSYWNVHSNDTAVRLITTSTENKENVLRSNVQITYTASSGNFLVNIVPETVTNTLLLKFPTFNGVWNTATLADGIDDMAALLDRLASHPVVLLQSGDNEFRQCLRYVTNSDEQRVYFYIAGNKINGGGGNIYAVFNVTYDTDTAQFKAEYATYPDVKVYGVKQSIADPTNMVWERTDDAVGLISATQIGTEPIERDDFLSVYPFSKMKECNIVVDATGATEIIYKGDDRFGRDKDTFIEIPLFYMDRYIEDGYEYRKICEVQKGGFFPAPMFVENGRVLDRVYVAKYETSIGDDGVVHSCTGQLPCIEKTVSEFRELYKAKGKGFAGMDIRTLMTLQHLYLVRFAQKNTQIYIGGGYTGLMQPFGILCKDYSGNTGQKNTIQTITSPSYVTNELVNKFWTGMYVGFIRESTGLMYDRAKVTDIEATDGNYGILTLDKNVNFYDDTLWGGCPQPSGNTDGLTHDTGRTEYAAHGQNGTCAVKLFDLENMWGNVWHELDGVLFKNNTCYVGFDQTAYNDTAEGYIPVGTKMLNQPDLGSVGAQFCFIGNLWVDNVYKWLGYPDSVRGGSPTDKSMPDSGITQNNSYGDAYYFNNSLALAIEVHGGGFDHYERAGFFCHRCYNRLDFKWYLQGSRMQFKILP